MKKGIVLLFLFAAMVSTFYGIRKHFGQIIDAFPSQSEEEIQKRLTAMHPLLEDQEIIAFVLAENCEGDVERNLRSIFDQTYSKMRVILVDNGSKDRTYEFAKEWVENHGKGDRVTLRRMEVRRPVLEVFYEMISECDPHEIVAVISGKDWLSHENVFDHLNCAYANPDVWMTYSRAISHPEYQEVSGHVFSDSILREKKLRREVKETLSPLVTFYAGLFQEIKLQDLLYEGMFIDECFELALHLPLVEMGPEHILFLDEVSYVKNESDQSIDHKLHLQKVAAVESHLRSLSPYSQLSTLKLTPNSPGFHRYKSDVILFSEDNPLHLYACLESAFLNVRDINDVFVLYKGSDQEFQRAYLNLQSEFQTVQFLNVCDYPGNDFSTLISKVLANRRHASPYVVIGDDQMIFEERLSFHECIEALEKAHSNHFFLGLEEREGPLPQAISIAPGIFAWQLGEKGSQQGFTLTLCRKSLFEMLDEVNDLVSFKKYWKRHLRPEGVALFFEEKKTLPMGIDEETSLLQKKEWGHKFIEGYKIDLPSLSCEMEEVEKGELPLIKREKRRMITQSD